MNISPLNHGIDQVLLAVQPLPLKEFPTRKELPPDGQAVTDHVALLYPTSQGEQLIEDFARPGIDNAMLNSPAISSVIFDSLLQGLARAPEGSAAAEAFMLLQQQRMDMAYLQASLKNLVQA